jgi:hypothetical protein
MVTWALKLIVPIMAMSVLSCILCVPGPGTSETIHGRTVNPQELDYKVT